MAASTPSSFEWASDALVMRLGAFQCSIPLMRGAAAGTLAALVRNINDAARDDACGRLVLLLKEVVRGEVPAREFAEGAQDWGGQVADALSVLAHTADPLTDTADKDVEESARAVLAEAQKVVAAEDAAGYVTKAWNYDAPALVVARDAFTTAAAHALAKPALASRVGVWLAAQADDDSYARSAPLMGALSGLLQRGRRSAAARAQWEASWPPPLSADNALRLLDLWVGSSHAVSKPALKALSWSLLAAGGRTAAHARLALRDCELAIHLCATPPDEAWEWVEPTWRRRLDDMGGSRELPDLVRALQVAAISGRRCRGRSSRRAGARPRTRASLCVTASSPSTCARRRLTRRGSGWNPRGAAASTTWAGRASCPTSCAPSRSQPSAGPRSRAPPSRAAPRSRAPRSRSPPSRAPRSRAPPSRARAAPSAAWLGRALKKRLARGLPRGRACTRVSEIESSTWRLPLEFRFVLASRWVFFSRAEVKQRNAMAPTTVSINFVDVSFNSEDSFEFRQQVFRIGGTYGGTKVSVSTGGRGGNSFHLQATFATLAIAKKFVAHAEALYRANGGEEQDGDFRADIVEPTKRPASPAKAKKAKAKATAAAKAKAKAASPSRARDPTTGRFVSSA